MPAQKTIMEWTPAQPREGPGDRLIGATRDSPGVCHLEVDPLPLRGVEGSTSNMWEEAEGGEVAGLLGASRINACVKCGIKKKKVEKNRSSAN